MNHAEIVKVIEKLIGPVVPVGCSDQNGERLKNLSKLGLVVDDLAIFLAHMTYYAESHEASTKAIGLKAIAICRSLEAIVEGTELPSERTETTKEDR